MRGLRRLRRSLGLVVLGCLFFIPMLLPLYWVVVASVQDLSNIFAAPPSFVPVRFVGSNYSAAFGSIIGNIAESFVIALSVTGLCWLLGAPAAHALARWGGSIANGTIIVMLITQMVPGISISLGLYTIFHQWGLLASYVGLILADTIGGLPFVIIVLRAYMVSLPEELFDAAEVDGASEVRLLSRVAVPLSVPGILTVGLFTFLGAWSDFVNAYTLNSGGGPQPLTLGLYKFVSEYSTDYGAIFAAAVLAAIPTGILLFVGQRWIRGGLRAGALRG
jgi:multiple sugar transport system permease protein